MSTHLTHVLPVAAISRTRTLPGAGKVLVRTGQQVIASDVVAEMVLPGKHILYDVWKTLGVQPKSRADRIIERNVGEYLEEGDIIGQASGMFKKVVRAPAACRVAAIQRGQVLLELPGEVLRVLAGINGTVTEIIHERGAVIETNGALIQGVWGNQQIDTGVLIPVVKSAEEPFTRALIDISMRGAVLLAGTCNDASALQAAAELPVRGLILGSLAVELIPVANAIKTPIIVLEGFGSAGINSAAYRLLTTNAKRDTCINAQCQIERGERPEIVIPLPAYGDVPLESVDIEPGRMVRIVTAPYASQIGVVERVRPGLTVLSNGLKVPAADIRLENQTDPLICPLSNLDVIE